MLEMRAECERCHAELPLASHDARICSFECTFCASCADERRGICPNCLGELVVRLPRAVIVSSHLAHTPPCSCASSRGM